MKWIFYSFPERKPLDNLITPIWPPTSLISKIIIFGRPNRTWQSHRHSQYSFVLNSTLDHWEWVTHIHTHIIHIIGKLATERVGVRFEWEGGERNYFFQVFTSWPARNRQKMLVYYCPNPVIKFEKGLKNWRWWLFQSWSLF